MDLTFTDRGRRDLGLIQASGGDFAWGLDENDFSVDVAGVIPPEGGLLYLDGSDVGGVVRGYSTKDGLAVVGDTWTGVLDSHVLAPDPGKDYLTLSGDASSVVSTIIARLGLSGLFFVPELSGVVVRHTFTGSREAGQEQAGRYMGGWQAIWQMLVANALSCSCAWDGEERKVALTIARRADLTDDEAQQTAMAEVAISVRRPTNHLVCLGQGELAAREVLHLYADKRGNVSTSQTQFGLDEVAETYSASSDDSAKLRSDGISRLRKLWQDSQEVAVAAPEGVGLRLGDLVGGTDPASGISASAIISKRVLSFTRGVPSWSYESTVRG